MGKVLTNRKVKQYQKELSHKTGGRKGEAQEHKSTSVELAARHSCANPSRNEVLKVILFLVLLTELTGQLQKDFT